MKINIKYTGLLFLIYLFLFWNPLSTVSSIFKSVDEIVAICAIIYVFIYIFKKKFSKKDYMIIVLMLLIDLLGVISNLINYHANIQAVLSDALICNKFVFVYIFTKYYFKKINFQKFEKKFRFHIEMITFILFFLLICDRFFKLFDSHMYRGGIYVSKLFFTHPTYLVATSVLLLCLYNMCNPEKKMKYWLVVIMNVLLMISTVRSKAAVFAAIYFVIYYLVDLKDKKITLGKTFIILTVMILCGYSTFEFYFIDNDTARLLLVTSAITLGFKYFPLGTGFASFGSYYSGVYYSKIYYMLGINTRWGLSESNHAVISDNFWPMIIGQFGFIGLVLFALIIFLILKNINQIFDKSARFVGILALTYIVIQSTSVSAFVSPVAVPLAFVIGLCFKDEYSINVSSN